tara:strand:+ start:492 stop:1166 length:675 start_codon:yes stop_codon:yes gene_type:complete
MIVVSGGTSGLGLAITDALRGNGEDVITLSRTFSSDSRHYQCDVSDYESVKNVYWSLRRKNISVYALINCAGTASMNLALTTPPDITNKIIKTNLLGTIFINQVFAPLLIKNKAGRIINFSSIAVNIGLKGESVYVASKAGVEGFSRVLANELAPFNITVNCIAPGPVKTNLLKGISDKQIGEIACHQIIKSIMNPADIVDVVLLLLSPNSSKITGQVLNVGGF